MKNMKYLWLVFITLLFCGRPEVSEQLASFAVVGECPLPGYAKKVVLVDSLAYVANGQGGLQIVDISDPESTFVIGQYVADRDVGGVAVRDTFAYIALGSSTSGGLVILNIADPTNPTFIGQDPSIYAYDVAALPDDTMYVYIAAGYWFHVEDVYSYPQYPSYVRRFTTPGDIRAVSMVDSIAFLGCEQMGLQIIDLSRPDSTALAGWIDTPSNAQGLFATGNYAYIADGRGGLIIIDVSDIDNPSMISQYDTPDYANNVFIHDDKAYVADGDGGLQVIDLSDPAEPQLYGSMETSYANGIYVRNDTIYIADRDMGLVIAVEEER
ncbi:MAG: hypothetical protein JSV53_09395 [candidate division WOR-3 bacterium]|nr:MAG: hypothetical protein JSV53_09395 [candidate division WOR-3 bacterium]